MNDEKGKITVYYDGACPRCVQDRCNYERWAGRRKEEVCWFDITGRDEYLCALGIDPGKALRELYVMDENRQLLSEMDAYILLLGKIPLLKPLAWLIGLPYIKPRLARRYHRGVDERLRQVGRL